MMTLPILSNRLALSEWQTRRLVYALRPLLQGMLVSKPGKALEISPDSIGLLERGADLKAKGTPLGRLAEVMQGELGPNGGRPSDAGNGAQGRPLESASGVQESELVALLRDRVEDLQRDRDAWRDLALDLQQRALPSPPRRWWRRVVGVASGSA